MPALSKLQLSLMLDCVLMTFFPTFSPRVHLGSVEPS